MPCCTLSSRATAQLWPLSQHHAPAQMQDAFTSSSAHPLLPCSAVSTMVWMLVGVICPMWEPQSCTPGLLEEFPSIWLGFEPGVLFCLILTVFSTYVLSLVTGLGPLFFPLLQQWPVPAAPLAFPGTRCCQGRVRDPSRMQRSRMDGRGLEESARARKGAEKAGAGGGEAPLCI